MDAKEKKRDENQKEKREELSMLALPTDNLREILHRLSLKSLTISRLGCKELNLQISDPEFMNEHNKRRLFGDQIILYDTYDSERSDIFVVEYNNLLERESALSCPLRKPCYLYDCEPIILGSYNGLVAVKYGNSEFMLWNPLTQEDCYYDPEFWHCGFLIAMGLCYDNVCDEYLAVIVGTFNYREGHRKREITCTQLVNFNTSSCKFIDNWLCENNDTYLKGVGTVVYGVPHWIMEDKESENPWERSQVVYFDLYVEEFNILTLPEEATLGKTILGLGALNGQQQLGVVVHDASVAPQSYYEVWMMKEYGIVESWSKLCKISSTHIDDCPLSSMQIVGSMPTPKLLLRYAKYCELSDQRKALELLAYDIEKSASERIEIPIPCEGRHWAVRMSSYEPSLISPPLPDYESYYGSS